MNKIIEGMEDAVAYSKGDKSRGRTTSFKQHIDARGICFGVQLWFWPVKSWFVKPLVISPGCWMLRLGPVHFWTRH